MRDLGVARRSNGPLVLIARADDGRRVAHLFPAGESVSSQALVLDSADARNDRALSVAAAASAPPSQLSPPSPVRAVPPAPKPPSIATAHIHRVAQESAYVGRINTTAYADLIRSASRRHGVPEALIRAVMHSESSFNPNAESHAGAVGLMQLMPATAERFGVNDRLDPAQSIEGGVRYLRWLIDHFDGDTTLAIAGYNAGEGAVRRHGGIPPFRETQNFVVRVTQRWERYAAHESQGG